MSEAKIFEPKACEEDMKSFCSVVFGNLTGLCALRSFPEKGNKNSRSVQNAWVPADDELLPKMLDFATRASSAQGACYVIPGSVLEVGKAGSADVAQMQALLIDIDDGDTEGILKEMSSVIGEPSLVVESGGVTKEGSTKLHVYWKLTEPASGDDLKTLLELRHKIALEFGGDTHFKSAHQPIRVAGSVYHKNGESKPVKVRSYDPVEYELGALTDILSCLTSQNNKTSSGELKTLNKTTVENEIIHNKAPSNNIISFAKKPSIDNVFTSKAYEGASGGSTRFANLQRVIGFWLRRHHDGMVSQENAMEEIYSYNDANVVPSWPRSRIDELTRGLWKKHVKEHGDSRKVIKAALTPITSYSLSHLISDKSKVPEDLIAPRILTPGGLFVFGGAPKVGKSDFLLSLFVHLAAGKEFVGLKPPRPLKIFYFQAEIGYHYLRERLQNMQLDEGLIEAAKNNLFITPHSKIMLDQDGVSSLASHVRESMPGKPDIIAVDPIRNVFDGGGAGATENDNSAMLFFLKQRIEALRDQINPEAGIVLVHHTKKISSMQFDEDPFQAFSGASSLRGYYTTGSILRSSEENHQEKELLFELRNGGHVAKKSLVKNGNRWLLEGDLDRRVTFKKQGTLFDKERKRRIKIIISLLESEAKKGKFYLMKQFAEKFQNHKYLGGKRAIYDDCSIAATKGIIMFFDNPEEYNSSLSIRGSFGLMCTENMKIKLPEGIDNKTGEIIQNYQNILPTHYKRDGDGIKIEIQDEDYCWGVF